MKAASDASRELLEFESQLKHFRTWNDANDAIMASNIDIMKARYEVLTQNMGSIKSTSARGLAQYSTSQQQAQHLERVLQTLELQLRKAGMDFKAILEKRAKSVAAKRERRQQLFGTSRWDEYRNNNNNSTPVQPPPTIHPSPQQSRPAVTRPPPPEGVPFALAATVPQPTTTTTRRRPPLLPSSTHHQQQPPLFHYASSTSFESDHHQQPPLFGFQEQQQHQQQREPERKFHHREKLEAVQRIERSVAELGQMFVRVAGVVREHEEVLLDIEANVDDTLVHTTEAQNELMKLFQFVSGDRALIIKMFVAITVVGMIVIYFWT